MPSVVLQKARNETPTFGQAPQGKRVLTIELPEARCQRSQAKIELLRGEIELPQARWERSQAKIELLRAETELPQARWRRSPPKLLRAAGTDSCATFTDSCAH